eukprot:256517-Chlamydomonas_euryale.AAC.8
MPRPRHLACQRCHDVPERRQRRVDAARLHQTVALRAALLHALAASQVHQVKTGMRGRPSQAVGAVCDHRQHLHESMAGRRLRTRSTRWRQGCEVASIRKLVPSSGPMLGCLLIVIDAVEGALTQTKPPLPTCCPCSGGARWSTPSFTYMQHSNCSTAPPLPLTTQIPHLVAAATSLMLVPALAGVREPPSLPTQTEISPYLMAATGALIHVGARHSAVAGATLHEANDLVRPRHFNLLHANHVLAAWKCGPQLQLPANFSRPHKQVPELVIVDLEHLAADAVLVLYLPLRDKPKEIVEGAAIDADALGVADHAAHRVRLAGARLAICKDAHIVAYGE